ncbi:molecular chaperone DnaJ [Actinocorallia longicatena]|uniref:Uncharacterized protein n=1 Tax=Actinocorallia longicatena TaxID=111803 RepID=A0ABP6QMD1_9ACTN
MQRPGDQRRRGRRDARAEQAQTAALQAKEQAAEAFYDMDQAQKYVGGRLTLLGDLDLTAADRLRPRFERADATANEAALAYITIVDAHDLDDVNRAFAEYDAGHRALSGVTETLKRVTAEINQVAAEIQPQLARLESSLDQLPPRLRAAQAALQSAQEAVTAARDAGMRTGEVEADLEAVQALLAELNSAGLGGLGLQGAMRRAEEITARAGGVAEEARALAVAVQKTRNDLASVRTRVQMVAGRRERVVDAMSVLRRSYAAACWQDLQGAPNAIEQALERSRERIAETDAAAGRQEWREVARSLAAARAELKDAERRAKAVTDRVDDLREAEADPGKPLEQARFAVRDAQRLAVAQPGGAAPRHAQALDALVARLERAPGTLEGGHPDYWAYLKELRSITQQAHDVVEIIRSEHSPR